MTIKVRGVSVTMRQLKKDVNRETRRQFNKIKVKLKNDLVEATPIDTGKAREGWEIKGDSIVNDVDYIDDLNAGSSRQAGPRFIERTLLANKGISPGMMRCFFERNMRKICRPKRQKIVLA